MGGNARFGRGPRGFPGSGGGGTLAVPSASPTWYYAGAVLFSELAAADNENDIEVYSIPARVEVSGVYTRNLVAWDPGFYSASLGVAATPELFLPSFELTELGNPQEGVVGFIPNYTGVTSMRLFGFCSGGNLDDATAGSLGIWLKLALLPVST